MPIINLNLSGDGAWPDLQDKEVIHLTGDVPAWEIAALERGMTSGSPSLALRLDLPDGRVVIAETSVKAFLTAAAAIRAKFPGLG